LLVERAMKQIFSIKASGEIFGGEIEYALFKYRQKIQPARLAITYGVNGSGKSTIASLFQNEWNAPEGLQITIAKPALTPEEINDIRNRTFLFNEDYILNHIKFSKSQSLEGIVMFGQQVASDNKIQELETEKKKWEGEYDSKSSSQGIVQKVLDDLQGELRNNLSNLWATREQEIEGLQTKKRVSSTILEEIKKPIDPEANAANFKEELKDYLALKNAGSSSLPPLPQEIVLYEFPFDQINTLLAKAINQQVNVTSPFVARIQSELKSGNQPRIENSKSYFAQPRAYCPYCMRDISSAEISELLGAINMASSHEAEDFLKQLQAAKLPEISSAFLSSYDSLDRAVFDSFSSSVREINKLIGLVNESLSKKEHNLYSKQEPLPLSVLGIIRKFNETRQKFSEAVTAFNSKILHLSSLQNKLQKENTNLARKETENLQASIDEKGQEVSQLSEEAEAAKIKVKEIDKELETENAKKKSVSIAEDYINRQLKIIFGISENIQIINSDGQYFITRNERKLDLSKLSTGQRNAIALVYFFSSLANGMKEGEPYKDPMLLVIDDPVTSFDIGNSAAVTGFLRSAIEDVLQGNPDSQVIIFTHSIQTAIYLGDSSDGEPRNDSIYNVIDSFSLENDVKRPVDTYSYLMKTAFLCGKNGAECSGNEIRRLVEAFSTFLFRSSISKVLAQKGQNARLPESQSKYFQSTLLVQILNSESHSENGMKDIDSLAINPWTKKETTRAARDAIMLLYLLEPAHVLTILENEGLANPEETIKQWIETAQLRS